MSQAFRRQTRPFPPVRAHANEESPHRIDTVPAPSDGRANRLDQWGVDAMDQGAGWVIYEDHGNRDEPRRLLALLPAHNSYASVARIMERMYAERFASMEEPVPFSGRRPRRPRFMAQKDASDGAIYVGHLPVYIGAYAHRLRVTGSTLEFWYRIASRGEPARPVFEDRHQVLSIGWQPRPEQT